MPMRYAFRAKIVGIAGSAACAFIVLIVASSLVARRVTRRLDAIERHYLPKIALAPQLRARLRGIARALQDAVAAKDVDALRTTAAHERELLDRVARAHDIIGGESAARLTERIAAYYRAATDVSRRMIAGETGEPIVGAIAAMQRLQKRARRELRAATRFDPARLAAAFSGAHADIAAATRIRRWIGAGCVALVLLLSLWLGRGLFRTLAALSAGFERFGAGAFDQPIPVTTPDELGIVAQHANQMADALERIARERASADWLKEGLAGLAHQLRGDLSPEQVGDQTVRYLARYLELPIAALYGATRDGALELLAAYALDGDIGDGPPARFAPGEGLVGQAARDGEVIAIADVPTDYLRVRSSLGDAAPRALVVLPLAHATRVVGVLEVAMFATPVERARELLSAAQESIAIALEVATSRARTHALLAETRELAERLGAQDEELRAINEELQAQQEELRQSNEELANQADELSRQRATLQRQNAALDEAHRTLKQKADELATVSTYKSEFLTNMSHELRTPLNSMLLLSSLLADNAAANLSPQQVDYCKTIHSAGQDLLALINQVLDLAKVEAGKLALEVTAVSPADIVEHMRRVFTPLARHEGLTFHAELAPTTPELETDAKRVEQILTNLVGNAIKFTAAGDVTLRVGPAAAATRFGRRDLRAGSVVAFSVSDTGPGIAAGEQARIFAPFEQGEQRSTSGHGGTGLGLSIARKVAALLGGELQLASTPGEGSTFTLYLPLRAAAVAARVVAAVGDDASDGVVAATPPAAVTAAAAVATATAAPAAAAIDDDRATLAVGDPYLLVVEDDPLFGHTCGEVIRAQGLAYVLASDGHSGLARARSHPPSGVILDVSLPDIDGFAVLESLRADARTAEVPVHFVSAVDETARGLALGAVGYLTKPVSRRDLVGVIEAIVPKLTEHTRRVLVVENDESPESSVLPKLRAEKLDARCVTDAAGALAAIEEQRYGCMILDLSLPDMDGLELLERVEQRCGERMPAVIVYTARPLSKAEAQRLEAYAEAIVLKEGRSTERLLNEVRLFARRLRDGLSPRRAARAWRPDVKLDGCTVLVVDDDMRTVYALSALLRAKGAEVAVADTGRAALDVLHARADIDAVLMDIMMPEMDGYQAIAAVRGELGLSELPIIALTAKAMKGDRQKCLDAGASAYLPKPIDSDRLLALLGRCVGVASGGGGDDEPR